ncbi:MAG: choice-of-anchor B family protein [Bacteroidota bacterium]
MQVRFTVSLFLFFSSIFSVFSQQHASLQVDFVGQLDYSEVLSDVWGYVDSLGREYAIVGVHDGVSIVSVSDSTDPVELQFIPGATTIWRDMKTYGHHGYVSNEGGNGLLIMDLSTLPGQVAFKDTIISGLETIHNIYIDEKGRLYTAGGNTGSGGMVILDLTIDPWNPTVLGSFQDEYVHDVYARGNLAYAAEINRGVLDIVDMSDPSAPVSIGSTTYQGAFTHNTWLNDAGTVCFTTDELEGAYITAWDVRNPSDIRFLDRIRSPLSGGTTTLHNVHVLNDFLVISYYTDGIYIVDASRPEALVEVGYYDTSPISGPGFSGSWGAYPFLPSGIVLASDVEEGLFVLKPTYTRAAFLEGMVIDSITGAPIHGAEVTLLGENETTISNLSGEYVMGVANGGDYSVMVSKYGYVSKTITVNLTTDQATIEQIELEPLPRVPLEIIVKDAKTLLPIEQVRIQAVPETQTDIQLDFLTDLDGRAEDTYFVPNEYHIIVGIWGHRTIDTLIDIQAATTTTLYLEQGYYDDFALDFDWQVIEGASTGNWERGLPDGTTRQGLDIAPGEDIPKDIGGYAYVTGNGGGNFFSDDIDDGTTELISPPIDVSSYNEPMLRFHWWFVNFRTQNGGGAGNDILVVELSDGVINLPIIQYTDSFSNQWTLEDSFLIPTNIPWQNDIFVRFIVGDEEGQNIVEAGIDGFEIIDGDPPIDPPTALDDILGSNAFRIIDNPIQDQLRLMYDVPEAWRGDLDISLMTIQGQELQNWSLTDNTGALQLDFPYASGLYIAALKHKGKIVALQKVLK